MMCPALFDLHQFLADHGINIWHFVATLCGDF